MIEFFQSKEMNDLDSINSILKDGRAIEKVSNFFIYENGYGVNPRIQKEKIIKIFFCMNIPSFF